MIVPKYIYKGFKKWYGRTPSEHKKLNEKRRQAGSDFREYGISEFIERFGRALVLSNMDETNASLMKAADAGESWKKKFERQISKYKGSKMKMQMILESRRESGVNEICIPLFDEDIMSVNDGEAQFDMDFVKKVLSEAKEMKLTLCIEVVSGKRTEEEWRKLLRSFADAIRQEGLVQLLSGCRFITYFDEFEKMAEAKELADSISKATGCRDVRMALRFD